MEGLLEDEGSGEEPEQSLTIRQLSVEVVEWNESYFPIE